jgi:methyl-accepting chemotaxis protein
MDFETIKAFAIPLVAALCAVIWYLYQQVVSKVEKAQNDLADFKLHVAEKYVNHNDLADALNGIKDVLGGMSSQIKSLTQDFKEFTVRVYDKLDQKADKE